MPDQWDIESLRARIRSLESEINRVSNKDHPYPEPDTIYRALTKVIRTRTTLLEEAVRLYDPGAFGTRALRYTFNTVAKDMDRVAEVFSLTDRVDSARIPFEILGSLAWVAEDLLGECCRTVVRLDPVYSYSILSCRAMFDLREWSDEWHAAVQEEAREHKRPPIKTVLVLGFPSSDASSILLHALAAHELGHSMVVREVSQLNKIREAGLEKVRQKYNERLKEYVEDWVAKRIKSTRSRDDLYEFGRKQVESRLQQTAEGWLVEALADLIACRLVGPAHLAAYHRVDLGLTEPTESHPPGALRRKWLASYLFNKMPQIAEDQIWKRVLTAPTETTSIRDLMWDIGTDLCESSMEQMWELIQKVPSPLTEYDNLQDVTEEIEDCIDNLVPPSVPLSLSGDASDSHKCWLLMYVAWHFRLNEDRFTQFATRNGWGSNVGKAESALGNLLLHALKSLELRYRWKQYLDANGGARGS